MIFGHINNTADYHYPAAVAQAIRYLKGQDLQNMPAGRYQDSETGWLVQVLDLQTGFESENYPEAHRKFIDVQYLISGEEYIGVATDSTLVEIHQPYDATRDIIFYRHAPNETLLLMKPGNFAVFFPQDLHRPNCAVNEPGPTRKVVVKIPVADCL
ncbi:YhcH/YjgK/YiaL family protein [uncultured Cedecea sp.]|uniref:YhcH/YjgK/YiaL family protein n=1 Tax=uncultured Cedecea sp. TaxID=988762 RepID=UPI002632CA40|nr:YhcH/YjgK/YiaL family protein [uncultured Cedecea sp.]